MNKRIIFLLLSMVLMITACSKTDQSNPEVNVTDNPVTQSAEPTTEPENQNSLTEAPTDEPTEAPTVTPTATPTAEPTTEPVDPTAVPTEEEKRDFEEDFTGYYKITEISASGVTMSHEYFDIFEKHGAFLITINIKDDGTAVVTQYEDSRREDVYTYDDSSFKHIEKNNELLYVFKDGRLTLLEAGLLGSAKSTFVKMTEEEIAVMEKGFSVEEFSLATEYASKLLENDEQLKNNEYISYIEKSRRATDESDYMALYSYAQVALCDEEIAEMLNSGHSYSIIMTKDGTKILMDGTEVTSEDLFYKRMLELFGNDFCADIKIRGSVGDEYIIDIGTDLTVTKTKAPNQEDKT